MLQSQLSGEVLQQLSQQIDAPPQQTAEAANDIFAALLGGLAGNAAASQNGLQSLLSALDRDHDGSILDDLAGMIAAMANNNQSATGALNGAGILNHVLGDKQGDVAQQISERVGLSMQQVMKLMPLLAPIVMAVIGRARQSSGLDVGGLLQTLLGSAQSAQQSSPVGDLVGALLSGALSGQQASLPQGGGLLGQLLGGLFGKR